MPFEIARVNKDELEIERARGGSEHSVRRAVYGAHTVFAKELPLLEASEEATFAALYGEFLGSQVPKTSFMSEHGQDIGVVSYALNNFVEYRQLDGFKHRALSRTIFTTDSHGNKKINHTEGLAAILMGSWLYGEDDLHRGNFGVATDEFNHRHWVRLDFGLSFSSITYGRRIFRNDLHKYNAITLDCFNKFPILGENSPRYWPAEAAGIGSSDTLCFWKSNKNAFSSVDVEIFRSLAEDETFQQEKYRFMLQLFMTPIEDKKIFILQNIPAPRGPRLADSIENRILMMRWTALSDEGFREYAREALESSLSCGGDVIEDSVLDALMQESYDKAKKAFNLDSSERSKLLKYYQESLVTLNNTLDELRAPSVTHYEFSAEKAREMIFDLDFKLAQNLPDTTPYVIEQALQGIYTQVQNHYQQQGQPQLGLDFLQGITIRRTALAPINRLASTVSSDGEVNENLQSLCKNIRNNWLIPNFVTAAARTGDELHQQVLPSRLRNIESLLTDFSSSDIEKIFEPAFSRPSLENLAAQKLTEAEAEQAFRKMEKELVTERYNRVFKVYADRVTQLSSSDTPEVIDIADSLNQALVFLPRFIGEKFNSGHSVYDVDHSEFVKSLILIDNCFDSNFTQTVLNKALANKTLAERLARDLCNITDHPPENKTIELGFILSRLRLDMEIANAKENNSSALLDELIEANEKLSKAMSRPDYHDKEELYDVAKAGLLGVKALQNPNQANADACLRHAQLLAKSGKTRMATKVAFSVGLVGLTIMVAGLAAMLPVCAAASGGIALISFAYALKRYLRDPDKVQRKLSDVGEEALRSYGLVAK